MSNVLTIQVVEVKVVGTNTVEYGFLAKDSYDSLADINYPSLKSFVEMFPTERHLIDAVLQSDEFRDAAGYGDSNVLEYYNISGLGVEGYPGKDFPELMTVERMHDIFLKNDLLLVPKTVTYIRKADSNSHVYLITFHDDTHNEENCIRVTLNYMGGNNIKVEIQEVP